MFYVSQPAAEEFEEGRRILDKRWGQEGDSGDGDSDSDILGRRHEPLNTDGDTASSDQEQPVFKEFGEFLF